MCISLIFELIFGVDSLKKSTDVSVTTFVGINKLPVIIKIHWHFKGKWSKFSRSALDARGSCFKNLAFPCPQGTVLIELKVSKPPKCVRACISTVLLAVI